MKEWEERTSTLIEAAFSDGKDRKRDFLFEEPDYAQWGRNAREGDSEEQTRMALLLDRLTDLMKDILRREANPALTLIEMPPDFDVWLWMHE